MALACARPAGQPYRQAASRCSKCGSRRCGSDVCGPPTPSSDGLVAVLNIRLPLVAPELGPGFKTGMRCSLKLWWTMHDWTSCDAENNDSPGRCSPQCMHGAWPTRRYWARRRPDKQAAVMLGCPLLINAQARIIACDSAWIWCQMTFMPSTWTSNFVKNSSQQLPSWPADRSAVVVPDVSSKHPRPFRIGGGLEQNVVVIPH